jgi:hypothetical protein
MNKIPSPQKGEPANDRFQKKELRKVYIHPITK